MIDRIIDNISRHYVGKRRQIEIIIAVMLAGGHILIEDVPGVGKTTLAKSLAGSISCGFTRIQFTPDTLPGDVVGTTIYNMGKGEFEVVKGAIMNNIILADELNRTSAKTQASLLEAMQEGQVTVDGTRYGLPELFMVIATQNPSTHAGTYELPEAELDRFMIKLSLGYPDCSEEKQMLRRLVDGMENEAIEAVATEEDIIRMKNEVAGVYVSNEIIEYVTDIVRKTREHEEILLGASPRAAAALIKLSRGMAYIDGRDYVLPDDIKHVAKDVLAHRIIFNSYFANNSDKVNNCIDSIVESVKIPDGIRQ